MLMSVEKETLNNIHNDCIIDLLSLKSKLLWTNLKKKKKRNLCILFKFQDLPLKKYLSRFWYNLQVLLVSFTYRFKIDLFLLKV